MSLVIQPLLMRALNPNLSSILISGRGFSLIQHRRFAFRAGSGNNNSEQNQVHINTAPIEFTANLLAGKNETEAETEGLKGTALKALRCNDTTSDSEPQHNMENLPFKVKLVDKGQRKQIKESKARVEPRPEVSLKKTYIEPYLQLSKPRLTVLVMLSAICSYALSPYPATVLQLLSLTVGTTLCSASANAINMGREPDFDRQMIRTQARPVVRGIVSPNQAFKFATAAGTLGTSILWLGVNPTVAFLGFSNIALYAWLYTSLKRKHIINTWVGALVGAIPPLMGWAASSPLSHPGAWCLAGLLYAWQFPHFNTLSHNIRNEYKNAGYVMTAWKNPKLNARVALRYSLLMFPLCFGLSYFNVTDWYYQLDSAFVNAWMSLWAFKFYFQQKRNYSKEIYNNKTEFNKGLAMANVYARRTFWVSVLHLPAVLILAILHKKDRWDWLFEDKKQLSA
ncbi:protoheme IX farnesyltransferase [Kluyveromyces lactis]|uniref:Protoheme IX farnesyltransferase, mitochondrial n=1 Tax=Kluyveromyces lactis (strain ATCC 8585 / CBS 2359 / DSM 70799 / NBRC 1267 / NRRL Y-1140 / WM37) TaxID=284590 RepID=COX10_KLULA|nr:uncharacterized protein KLLA0_C09548g [Kluyveromyces lactis]Q6CTW6.1 RecName: Full=Protoheme IX farnesyltransferase, mitochondrial; AltName: Full=Heme O synthase; Flags: Precursor [Kluyveromyces lactis NRRL Y-1140]CAH01474.1 KLLA0C09548p [Kluyveromyces lactis]|eukprot:XP_452623.1 uncharacterized protein KLLA0_C09548g [Kluyveromyces lactis]